MTTRFMPLVLAAVVALGSGCAKPDWIQQTLVTVDVTGTWKSPDGLFDFRLEQQGSKVTGSIVSAGPTGATNAGPLAGSVAGDMFRFKQAAVSRTGSIFEGELSVSGDEMIGNVRNTGAPGGGFRGQVLLRRVDSYVPPPSQQR